MPARILTAADTPLVRELVAADPVCNVFVGSRVDAGVLNPTSAGLLWGWPAEQPRALLHVGANMVPVATDLSALPAFVEAAGRRRTCQSIVGPSWLAWPLWQALAARWGTSYQAVREVRRHQPVMALSRQPVGPVDHRVRAISGEVSPCVRWEMTSISRRVSGTLLGSCTSCSDAAPRNSRSRHIIRFAAVSKRLISTGERSTGWPLIDMLPFRPFRPCMGKT